MMTPCPLGSGGVDENTNRHCHHTSRGTAGAGAIWSAKAEIEGSEKLYCASRNVTPDIHLRVWQKFVEENPETLAKTAIETYLAAMRDAFPCEE